MSLPDRQHGFDTPGLRGYLRTFWNFDRPAALTAMGLNLAAALLEGVGLLLLLPLLHLAGVLDSGNASSLPFKLPQDVAERIAAIPPDLRLPLMLAAFVALVGIQAIVTMQRERRTQALQLRFIDHLRDRLFTALAQARWSFLSRHHSSEFLSVLTTDVQRVGVGTHFLLQLFTQLAVFPVYLGVAFLLSPMVTIVALATCVALWWLLRRSRAAAAADGIALSRANQSLFNELQEFLGALKLIKIHGEEDGYRRQFNHVVAHLRQQQTQFQVTHSRSQLAFRVGGATTLAALTWVALVVARVPAASLLVLIAIFSRVLPQVSSIHGGRQQLAHMLPAYDSWRNWMRLCAEAKGLDARDVVGTAADPEVGEARHIGLVTGSREPLREGIHLRLVSYRHPLGTATIHVPELFLPARRTTAIIGATGSGKTTLLDLISGLNTPDAGTITADGVPLEAANWCRHVAYVPQDASILDGTIRENLAWGAQADEAALHEALERVAAAGFVSALPDGLDTWVGERGVRLSGGEKQRLALARALLRQPELLILDEATSALDREHQQIVFAALRALRGRLTVLIVTHRHDEIRDLIDGLVVVEEGRVGQWTEVASGAMRDEAVP